MGGKAVQPGLDHESGGDSGPGPALGSDAPALGPGAACSGSGAGGKELPSKEDGAAMLQQLPARDGGFDVSAGTPIGRMSPFALIQVWGRRGAGGGTSGDRGRAGVRLFRQRGAGTAPTKRPLLLVCTGPSRARHGHIPSRWPLVPVGLSH